MACVCVCNPAAVVTTHPREGHAPGRRAPLDRDAHPAEAIPPRVVPRRECAPSRFEPSLRADPRKGSELSWSAATGDVEVRRGDHVHASDGDVGRVQRRRPCSRRPRSVDRDVVAGDTAQPELHCSLVLLEWIEAAATAMQPLVGAQSIADRGDSWWPRRCDPLYLAVHEGGPTPPVHSRHAPLFDASVLSCAGSGSG